MTTRPNKRGAGKGGFAVLRRAGRSWPALPDRERWVSEMIIPSVTSALLLLGLLATRLPVFADVETLLGAWQTAPVQWNELGRVVRAQTTVEFLADGTFQVTGSTKAGDNDQEHTAPLTVSGTFTLVDTNHIRLKVLSPKKFGFTNTPPFTVPYSVVGDRLELPVLLPRGTTNTQVYHRIRK